MFWKTRNYEKELEVLADKIRKARGSAQKAKLNNRRYRSLFLLYAVGIYCVYFVVALSTKSYQYAETKLRLLSSPFLIYSCYRALGFWLEWRESKAASHLQAVQNAREGLVQEYKEKVNYSQIQKVLASGTDNDTAATTTGSKQNSTQKEQPKRAQKTQKAASKTPAQNKQTIASFKDQIKRENGVWPHQAQPQPQPASPKQQLLNQPVPLSPMVSPKHSWMDRIADLVLGENEMSPNSRYALICPVCHAHNGLAQYGENPADVVYRCPYCGTLNGKSEKEDDSPDKHTTGSIDDSIDDSKTNEMSQVSK